ncbi:MAG: hypothetical protein K2Q15_10520 [Burkholderiales bacterium]|nr:hypothetical protein [Burkholderiales bacterium]
MPANWFGDKGKMWRNFSFLYISSFVLPFLIYYKLTVMWAADQIICYPLVIVIVSVVQIMAFFVLNGARKNVNKNIILCLITTMVIAIQIVAYIFIIGCLFELFFAYCDKKSW